MPELPDLELYLHALAPRVVGRVLERITVIGPSVLRSVDPPVDACEGRSVTKLRRVGKRIVLGLEDELFIVLHLMIAGRLRWEPVEDRAETVGGAQATSTVGLDGIQSSQTSDSQSAVGVASRRLPRIVQAFMRFDRGRLLLTEAGTRRRATFHVVHGVDALLAHDPGGLDPLTCTLDDFTRVVRGENRTLKRVLTDPRALSGIGNAYSDEILHRARLSPIALTQRLDDPAIARLHVSTRDVLEEWTQRLRLALGDRFPGPGTVTAFRPGMAVHGRFGKPCPACGTTVQRIVHAENETNYCPQCQTGGRVLADRSLSRLLKNDWPRTVEEWEGMAAPPPRPRAQG